MVKPLFLARSYTFPKEVTVTCKSRVITVKGPRALTGLMGIDMY